MDSVPSAVGGERGVLAALRAGEGGAGAPAPSGSGVLGTPEKPAGSDREGVAIADVARGEAGQCEWGLAGMSIGSLAFAPILSGLEVVVDRPEQRGPLEALLGAMVTAMTRALAEVPPEPLGRGPAEAPVVAAAVDEGGVEVERDQVGERGAQVMRGQAGECRL